MSTTPSKKYNTNLGIALMIIHGLALSLLYVVVKNLTQVISSAQVAFLYKLSVFVIMLPWCIKDGLLNTLRTKKLHLHIARAAFSLAGTRFFYESMKYMSIADATAMTYIEHVIILLIGIVYFKESLTHGKVVVTACGLIGVFIISKPSAGAALNLTGNMYIFAALVFWALNNIVIKILGKTEKTQTQLFYSSLIGSMIAAPMIYGKSWSGIEMPHFKYILSLAILHAIHVIAFFRALKLAEISAVIPFDYTRIVFSGILGYYCFAEQPSSQSIIGYMLIVGGGIYMIMSESRYKRKVAQSEAKT